MTAITEACTVTSAQLITFAGNVNDRRVIDEARELAAAAGVDPDLVAAIRYEPPTVTRKAHLAFVLFQVDEEGSRMRVHDDGTPWDEDSGKPSRFLTAEKDFIFRAELPGWWPQAVRTAVVTREPAE